MGPSIVSLYHSDGGPAYFGTEHLNQIMMFTVLYLVSMLRGYMLVRGGEALLPEHRQAIGSTRFWATVGMPWCYFVNLLALLGSAFGRTIVWRGIAYHMVSRTHTVVHRPHVGMTGTPHRAEKKANLKR